MFFWEIINFNKQNYGKTLYFDFVNTIFRNKLPITYFWIGNHVGRTIYGRTIEPDFKADSMSIVNIY